MHGGKRCQELSAAPPSLNSQFKAIMENEVCSCTWIEMSPGFIRMNAICLKIEIFCHLLAAKTKQAIKGL